MTHYVPRRRRHVSEPDELPTEARLLEGLNPEQRTVVEWHRGAVLVAAVAGAGKTRALVHRIAYLVAVRGLNPANILATTFSKKAAGEMNDRLRDLGVTEARVGTWHSLSLQILREELPDLRDWEIDARDRFRVIVKDVLGWQGMKWRNADLTTVLGYIGICKANAAEAGTEKAAEIAREIWESNPCGQNDPHLLAEAYFKAQEAAIQRRLLTFDDMLLGCWKLLRTDTAVRDRWSNKWDFCLQDEAQDENLVQAEIGEFLARRHGNYMIVGDPAQSIYGFRGALPEKFLAFEKEWNAEVIRMHRNYRSGTDILEAANGSIRAMAPETHLGVEITGERGVSGEVNLDEYQDADEEGEETAARILELHESGIAYRDIAVLYRTNAQSRGVEEACLSSRIPYVVIGGTNFYDRKEVKDLLAYLRAGAGRGGFDPVRRSLNKPFRFLGKAFLARVERGHVVGGPGRVAGEKWTETVRRVADSGGVQDRQRASAYEWAGLVDGIAQSVTIRTADAENEATAEVDLVGDLDEIKVSMVPESRDHMPAALLERVIKETDYMRYITRDEGTENVENNRVSNVRELVRAAGRFRTVAELLDYVDQVLEAAHEAKRDNRAADRVTLCSLHRSKGLEWPAVFVLGCNEKILPHGRADDIEEERRLFYVGITRAKDVLHLSLLRVAAFGARVVDCDPSRFIAEAGLEVAV